MSAHRTFDASRRRALLTLALLVPGGRALAAGVVIEALQRPAVVMRRPEQAVLLGAVMVGEKIVAVGERGLILLSDDGGHAWRQAATPVSVTLTAVRFGDAKNGVAVGHGGTILTSSDRGETWSVRMDGRQAASLQQEAARAGNDPAALRDAERMVAEGPDKPFFDVLMAGPSNILAVGAYGMIMASTDGGATWSTWKERLGNAKGLHYYAIRQQGETILIAGEAGIAFCSENGGKSFQRITTPYKGSYFTAELTADHEMVIAGLRGNVWRSRDLGKSWSQLTVPIPASITSSLMLPGGKILFTNQAGYLMQADGERLSLLNSAPLPPLNGVVAPGDKNLVALTMQGPMLVNLDNSEKAKG